MDHGHTKEEIRRMSLDAFNGFLKSIAKKDADRLKLKVTTERMIQHADQKEFQKFAKEINDV